jgi:hypothetical protein
MRIDTTDWTGGFNDVRRKFRNKGKFRNEIDSSRAPRLVTGTSVPRVIDAEAKAHVTHATGSGAAVEIHHFLS